MSLKYTLSLTTRPVFCLLLRVKADYAQQITGQVSEVTCPVIGLAQPELTPSKKQKSALIRVWVDNSAVTKATVDNV